MPLGSLLLNKLAAEEELAHTEDQIAVLQSSLYEIRQKINDAGSLPPDVMIEIFQEVLEENAVPVTAKYGCDTQPFQFTIGAVCRSWRNVAWGFSGLWKNLRFTFEEDRADAQLELVQEWIQRSGGLPLNISLRIAKEDGEDYENHPTLDCILRVILFECTRWESFAIAGEATCQLRKEMQQGRYSFPLLLSISFGIGSNYYEVEEEEAWTFADTVRLRKLAIEDGASLDKSTLGLNWATITDFTFGGEPAEGEAFLSTLAPSLRSTHVVFTDDATFETDIRFPALQTLTIGNEECGEELSPEGIMLHLSFPTLRVLTLHLPEESDECDLSTLSDAIRRSHCSLLELSIHNLYLFETQELIDLFRILPTLTRLELQVAKASACTLNDEIIDALNPPSALIPAPLPCLPHISEIVYNGVISFKPQKMSAFLKSRSRAGTVLGTPVSQLKSFTIHCTNPNWTKLSNANALRAFYLDAYAVKSSGTSFEIIYDSGDEGSESGDSEE